MFPCRNTNDSLFFFFSHVELLIEISAVERTVHDAICCFHFETTNNKAQSTVVEKHTEPTTPTLDVYFIITTAPSRIKLLPKQEKGDC